MKIHATLLMYQAWELDDDDDNEDVSTALEGGHNCAQLFHVSQVHDVGHVIDNLRVLSKWRNKPHNMRREVKTFPLRC